MFTSARSRGPVHRATTGLRTAPAAPLPGRPAPEAVPASTGNGFSWG
ncbi:hypothetical protein ACIQI7_05525 [Kitasatospora sp. NPDC092039]